MNDSCTPEPRFDPRRTRSPDDVINALNSLNQGDVQVDEKQWPVIVKAVIGDNDQSVSLEFDLSEHRFWFKGHFPEHPVLPGIVQLNWAGEITRRLFAPELKFSNLQSVKFQNTIGPQAQVNLQIDWCEERCRAVFQYFGDDTAYSSGRVYFS